MRRFTGAAALLVALGLMASGRPLHAAVATGNVRVQGIGPYDISYNIAETATSGSIVIKNSTGQTVKTIATTTADFTQGPHTLSAAWNGTNDSGTAVPQGNYYAVVNTTGGPHSAMTALIETPVGTADAAGTAFDGRSFYGGDANQNPNSPYQNLLFLAVANSSGSGKTGIYIANPDASPNNVYTVGTNAAGDWYSSSVLSDDNVVLTGNASGNVVVADPAGNVVATYGAGRVKTRMSKAFGTTAHPELFYIGNGDAISGLNLCYIPDVSAYTATSTPIILAASTGFPSSARTVVVNKAKTAVWISGALGTTGTAGPAYGWIKKFDLTKDGTGAITGATLDTTFNYQDPFTFSTPITYPTAANNRGLALSPDESVLWFSLNEGSAAFPTPNAIVVGYNPNTGAFLGNNYLYNAGYNPEDLSVTNSGNIYVTTYPGSITGTTAKAVGVVAPPDAGSTDSTRSPDFVVSTQPFTISNVQVKDVTFHSATITWTTNYPASSQVDYGTVSGAPDKNFTDTTLATTHSVVVDLLDSNTKYYFKVTSCPDSTNCKSSAESSFTTHTLTLSNVQVTKITDDSATVTFTTNDPAIAYVRWGYQSGVYVRHPGEIDSYVGLGQTAGALRTNHSITITGLAPGKTYYFVAGTGYKIGEGPTFADPITYQVLSAESTITTLGTIQILKETLATTGTSATLGFTTNVATTATVKYGATADALTNSADAGTGTTHSATLTGLASGAKVFYQIQQTGTGVAPLNSPVSSLTTTASGGSAATITHSTAADLQAAYRSQIALGASGGLISLERQGIPGTPVAGPVLPMGLRYTGIVAHNGYLYSIGGYDGTATAHKEVYVAKINADGSVGSFSATAPLPQERWLITNQCVGYNGYIYVVSGDLQSGTVVPTVYFAKQNADGTLGAWAETTPIPQERDLAGVAIADGTMFVTGGESNHGDDPMNTVFEGRINADGTISQWIQTRVLKDGVYLHRAVANGHNVYRVGGLSDNVSANYAVADLMSPEFATSMPNQQLTPFVRSTEDLGLNGNMDMEHYSMGTGLLHGKIVTVGGRVTSANYHWEISGGKLNPDGSTGDWSTYSVTYPVEIRDNDAMAYNGFLYCGTGRTAAGPNAETYYIPFAPDTAGSDPTYVYIGSLESKVIDFGAVSNLKHLTVAATGTGVDVRYRYAGADGVFSDWFSLNGLDADITGGARYFQYQLVLTSTGSSTPSVNSVSVSTAAGTLGTNDVIKALRIAGGLDKAEGADITRLNVAPDAGITLQDAVKLMRQINGL